MKFQSYFLCTVLSLLTGCSSSRSVLCVAPTGDFKPASESELLSELNAQLPFAVPKKRFISKKKPDGFVGWAVVRNDREKDVMKSELKKSTTLRLLQVETLTPELEAAMKQLKE
jgi:hypothetical protein